MRTELIEVADGVHAWLQPDGGWCLSNAGVIVNGDEVAVIDTAATEARARRLVAAISTISTAPARTVINTHFHGDHTFGNQLFRPHAAIVAHEACRTEAAKAGLGLCGLWPGVEWGTVKLTLPTLTYRDRLRLHVGDLDVELYHPGPAHTVTDTVVWIPGRKVLFTGDIVMSGATPFCLMGSITGSLRAIAAMRRLDPRVVVTGHGPVAGPEVLEVAEKYLRWVQELAAEGLRRGLTPLQTARAADLGEFRTLLDPERLVGNLHRAYAEQHGAPEGVEFDVLAIFHELIEYHGGPLPSRA
jgi:cyclase